MREAQGPLGRCTAVEASTDLSQPAGEQNDSLAEFAQAHDNAASFHFTVGISPSH